MEEDGGWCQGRVLYAPEYGMAEISILTPKDRGEEDKDPIEEDVVHELLHIRLEGHKGQEGYDPMIERALNVLAKVLVEGYGDEGVF